MTILLGFLIGATGLTLGAGFTALLIYPPTILSERLASLPNSAKLALRLGAALIGIGGAISGAIFTISSL